MKITESQNEKNFKDLEVGDRFSLLGDYFIKIHYNYSVRLKDGVLNQFDVDDVVEVVPVNGTFLVANKETVFGCLKRGDCFSTKEFPTRIMMKIPIFYDANSICLNDNKSHYFIDEQPVVKEDVSLILNQGKNVVEFAKV